MYHANSHTVKNRKQKIYRYKKVQLNICKIVAHKVAIFTILKTDIFKHTKIALN